MTWICGATGAGKSAAAWALFNELAASGQRVGYVDIDQLGMLYPETDDDPYRFALKSDALARLVSGYARAGAQLLLVSGVIDPNLGPRHSLPPEVDLTLCLLSPNPTVLRERILARGWGEEDAEEAVAEDALLRDSGLADVVIETSGMSVAETVERLRHVSSRLAPSTGDCSSMVCSTATSDVLVVTGPRVVGSSTIGFGLAMSHWRAGRRTGFADLQQLGFISRADGRTDGETRLGISQLATMHDLMTERGAERLVVSGHLDASDRALLRAALPQARVTIVRLRADMETLQEHAHARAKGSAARLAGDDLLDADEAYQDMVVATALDEQEWLDATAADDAVVDVSGRTPTEVVTEIQSLAVE